MERARWFAALVGVALCGACEAGHGAEDGDHHDEIGRLELDFASGVAADGQKIFAQVCTPCHGTDGLGQEATEANPGGPSLAEEVPEHEDAQIAWVVRNGLEEMDPQPLLTDQQLVDLVAYLRETFPP